MRLSVGTTTIALLFAMAAVLAAGIGASAGRAATLANADATAHTITIINKTKRETKNLAPGGHLAEVCESGCIVRIDGSPEKDFVLEGSERVTVEGGLLYYDGEVTGPATAVDKTPSRR